MKNFTRISGSLGSSKTRVYSPDTLQRRFEPLEVSAILLPDMQKTARSEFSIVLMRSSRAAIFKSQGRI